MRSSARYPPRTTVSSPGSCTPNSSRSARASAAPSPPSRPRSRRTRRRSPRGAPWHLRPLLEVRHHDPWLRRERADRSEIPPPRRSGRRLEQPLGVQARSRAASASTSGDGLPRARFSAFSKAESTTAMSARRSSAVTSASSAAGSRRRPKHRTTMASASICRSCARPWADAVPPGTSVNRTWAWTIFLDRSISARTSTRGSGTVATAWLALPPFAPARVSAVNSVDLPEKGTPTRPMSLISLSAGRPPPRGLPPPGSDRAPSLVSQKILSISAIASRRPWPCCGSCDFLASPASLVAFQNSSWRLGYFSRCSGLK